MIRKKEVHLEDMTKASRVLGKYATKIKIEPTCQHISADMQQLIKTGEHDRQPCTLHDFQATSIAADLAIDSLAEQMPVTITQELSRVLFREAVVGSLPEHIFVRYEEGMDPDVTSYLDTKRAADKEPTVFTSPCCQMPQVQLTGKHTYVECTDPHKKPINGSSLSPAAWMWSDQLMGPCLQQRSSVVPVVNGVSVPVLIVSDPGARNPNHVEPGLLGAVNSLLYGPRGKLWLLFPADFQQRLAQMDGHSADHTLYAKRNWEDWSLNPETLIKLGVRRILQPEGWMLVTRPVWF